MPAEQIIDHCTESLERWVDELEELVQIDSGTLFKSGLDKMAEWMCNRWNALGFQTEVRETTTGPNVIATYCSQRVNAPTVLLLGHIDTVYREGTPQKRPFTVRGNRAYGPGVADMKGGLITMLGALEALKKVGLLDKLNVNVTVFNNCDEEIGSRGSRHIIEELATGCDAVFVYEPARPSGAIVSQRRGLLRYTLSLKGKAAHTGVDPQNGASAIESLSRKVQALHALTDYDRGINVNVGTLRAGDRPNIVADWANAEVDVRLPDQVSFKEISAAIEQIITRCDVKGTEAKFEVTAEKPPFTRTSGVDRLLELFRKSAMEIGLSLEHVTTGGSSDGNYTSALGIPTIDGLGAVGGRYHSEEEYLEVNSIVQRAALSALALSKFRDFS